MYKINFLFFDRVNEKFNESNMLNEMSRDEVIGSYVQNIENILNSRSTLKVQDFFTNIHIAPHYMGLPSDLNLYIEDATMMNEIFSNIIKRIDKNVELTNVSSINSKLDMIHILINIVIFNRNENIKIEGVM